jgi:membrane protein insertase Oxa1/YidC/SpoIIIJ
VLFIGATQFETTNFEQDWNQNDPKNREKGGWILRKSSMTWIQRKFGKQSRKKTSKKEEDIPSIYGSLNSKEMEFLEPGSLHKDTVKLRLSISTKFAPEINDSSFRSMLIAKLIWELEASIINFEIVFLQRNRLKTST